VATHSVDEIAKYVTADTLGYITQEGLGKAVGDPERQTFCTACFSGEYLIGEIGAPAEAPSKLTA